MDDKESIEELQTIIGEYVALIDNFLRGVISLPEFISTYHKMPKIRKPLPHSAVVDCLTKWD